MSKRKVELSGQKFGTLTVIRRDETENKRSRWICKCECGVVKSISLDALKKQKSCGCKTKEIISQFHSKRIIDKRFGDLTVLEKVSKIGEQGQYLCRCICGKEKVIRRSHLTSGATQDCGCRRFEKLSKIHKKDITGNRYGRLTVIKDSGKRKNKRILWRCLCDCGNETFVDGYSLKSSNTKSCGCLFLEIVNSYKGSNHPQWNETLSENERGKRRNLVGLQEWTQLVYSRDNYKCTICKQEGGKLNAHHLDGWNSHPEKRLDPGNGVTLCVRCHKAFHRQFGSGNNTEYQFLKFKEEGNVQS